MNGEIARVMIKNRLENFRKKGNRVGIKIRMGKETNPKSLVIRIKRRESRRGRVNDLNFLLVLNRVLFI